MKTDLPDLAFSILMLGLWIWFILCLSKVLFGICCAIFIILCILRREEMKKRFVNWFLE